jgi:SAM-dependent methyltransferase
MSMHARYMQQATWTRDLRAYLFRQAGWFSARRILEVGCGTGAVLADPSAHSGSAEGPLSFGIDRSSDALGECRIHASLAVLTRADALALPFSADSFDITYCHFTLLWLKDPLVGLREMRRVTRGHVLALAEPDYSGRVDQPPELVPLGQLQSQALRAQGADVSIGSRLADLFHQAGIRIREAGVMKDRPSAALSAAELEAEWMLLQQDLAGSVPADDLERFRRLDASARQRGQRLLHVPTYYAWGQV